jgi:hypothetical protein
MKCMFLLALFLSFGCSAQVYRCADPHTGKVAYADAPCPTGTKAAQVEAAKSDQAKELERERAQLARERFQLQQERAQRPIDPQPQQVAKPGRVDSYACDMAKKNLGVGASKDSKMRSQREYEAACFGDKAADIEASRAGAPVTNIRINVPH